MALKSIVLRNGECFVLPKDAVITSIVTDGAITTTSSCGDTLPTPSAYVCGKFQFFLASHEDDDDPLDEKSTSYVSIKVGSNTYMINEYVINPAIIPDDDPGTLTEDSVINAHMGTDLPLFEITAIVSTGNAISLRQLIAVYFKVPSNLFDTLELKISDRGTFYYLKPIEFDCDSYPVPE